MPRSVPASLGWGRGEVTRRLFFPTLMICTMVWAWACTPVHATGCSGQREIRLPWTPALPRASQSEGIAVRLAYEAERDSSVPKRDGFAPASRPEWFEQGCDFDVIDMDNAGDGSNFTHQEFVERYYQHKPVVLRGAVRHWRAWTKWSKEYLVRLARKAEVKARIGTGVEIVAGRGEGKEGYSLSEFIESSGGAEQGEGGARYVFDPYLSYLPSRPSVFRQAPQLMSDIEIPGLFANRTFYRQYFLYGKDLSGVDFHAHADAWNALIRGNKRWFLYPEKFSIPSHVQTNLEYYQNRPAGTRIRELMEGGWTDIPQEQRPMQCIQQAGDILYLPGGWWHATISLGETVGVAQQMSGVDGGQVHGEAYHWSMARNFLMGYRYEDALDSVVPLLHRVMPRGEYHLVFAVAASLARRDRPTPFAMYVWRELRAAALLEPGHPAHVLALLWLHFAPAHARACVTKLGPIRAILERPSGHVTQT